MKDLHISVTSDPRSFLSSYLSWPKVHLDIMISFSLQQFLYWVSRILYPLDFLLPFWLFPPSLISSNFLKLGYPSSWIFFLSLPTPRSHPVHGFTICMLMVPIFIAEVHTSPLNSRLTHSVAWHFHWMSTGHFTLNRFKTESCYPSPAFVNPASCVSVSGSDNCILLAAQAKFLGNFVTLLSYPL